jgi:hypothetical protein
MNTIINTLEDVVVSIIHIIRDFISPFINKYAAYFKYISYFIYVTYAILLLGIYTTLPEYVSVLRNVLLYSAVFILLIRFNSISWNNPKFALFGGSTFSDFDRRLIMQACIFILITHIISESVINYTKTQVSIKFTKPVNTSIVQPIYKYIGDGSAS